MEIPKHCRQGLLNSELGQLLEEGYDKLGNDDWSKLPLHRGTGRQKSRGTADKLRLVRDIVCMRARLLQLCLTL